MSYQFCATFLSPQLFPCDEIDFQPYLCSATLASGIGSLRSMAVVHNVYTPSQCTILEPVIHRLESAFKLYRVEDDAYQVGSAL